MIKSPNNISLFLIDESIVRIFNMDWMVIHKHGIRNMISTIDKHDFRALSSRK